MRAVSPWKMRTRVEGQRVCRNDVEPAGIMGCDLFQCADGSLVPLDCDDAFGAFGKQRAREPAGPGTDFDDSGVA